jgi:phosphopentomutase
MNKVLSENKELIEKVEKILNQEIYIYNSGVSDVFIITELGNKLFFCVETGELHVESVPEIVHQDNHFPVSILIELRDLLRKV